MENLTDVNTNDNHKRSFTNAPLIHLTRVLSVPIEWIWKAWSDPDTIKEWWGPTGYSCHNAQIDFRVGGRYLLDMHGPDGSVIWSTGIYEEIIPYRKIVCTDQFSDSAGNPIAAETLGMPGQWPSKLYMTLEFEQQVDGQVKMTICHEGIPAEAHNDCVTGWTQTIDKLQKIVNDNNLKS